MLEVSKLSVAYGQHRALEEVSLNVAKGEIVVILGANGAGKSTLLRAIGGTSEGTPSGEVILDGAPIAGLPPHEIVERGVALVPEGRGVFVDLTVRENLMLGAYSARARADESANLERLLSLFPKLVERQGQVVRTMSGGEQQMVAIGRAMMSSPQILMLDEPSLGLSPLLCKELFHSLNEVRKSGLGILLVEQNAKQSLAIADRGYLLENARIMGEDTAQNLANDPAVQKAYLGVAPTTPTTTQSDAQTAAKSAAESALSFIATGGSRRRTRTDDIVSGGIDELVRHAASLSSEHVDGAKPAGASAPHGPAQPYQGPGDDLAAMLADMERAAAAARLPARKPETPAPKSSAPEKCVNVADTSDDAPDTSDDLPTIEVWRREPEVPPEIQIFKRTDGKLKRVKGD